MPCRGTVRTACGVMAIADYHMLTIFIWAFKQQCVTPSGMQESKACSTDRMHVICGMLVIACRLKLNEFCESTTRSKHFSQKTLRLIAEELLDKWPTLLSPAEWSIQNLNRG